MFEYAIAAVAVIVLVYVVMSGRETFACKPVADKISARVNPMYWPDSGDGSDACTPLFSPTTPDHVEKT